MAGKSFLGEPGKGLSLEDLEKGSMSLNEEGQEPPVEPTVPPQKPEPQPQEPAPQPKVEEKVEEPKKEEPSQETEPQQEPKESQFDFALFNKTVGKNYESLDQVRADLEKPTMESEYQEAQSKYQDLEQKYNDLNETFELLMERTDPLANLSEEAIKLEMFRQENPKKDASIAAKIFATKDLSEIDDLDMVKLGRRFKSSRLRGTEKDLENAIAEEFGQEPDTPFAEWPISAQNRLIMEADGYRDSFDKIKSGIKLPEKVNIEELKAQRQKTRDEQTQVLTEGWNKIAEKASNTSEIRIPVGEPEEGKEQEFFKWDVKVSQDDVNELRDNFIAIGLEPDEEEFNAALEMRLWEQNRAKIMKQYRDDLLARQKEQHLEETNNPNPLKDSQRSEPSDKEKDKKERSAWAMEGVGPRFVGHPFFSNK